MSRTADGRDARFTELVQEYSPLLARVCYMYADSQSPFDDLYQEVLINIWRGLEGFRADAKVSTWLYRLAINTCITYLRRNNRHANHLSLEHLPGNTPDLSPRADDPHAENLRLMYAMISELAPLEKAVVLMWLDDRSYDEIAAVTGLTKQNVGVRLHRIREKLTRKAQNL